MNDLDKKLQGYLEHYAECYHPEHEYNDSYRDENLSQTRELMEQIKRVFVDAGWVGTLKAGDKTIVMNGKDNLGYIVYYPNEMMTGQEWYDRFRDALEEQGTFMRDDDLLDWVAKKAAGLK